MTREGIHAPTRLLLFTLANSSLQWLDVRETIFGIGMDNGEMDLDSCLSMAITNHPSLRALFDSGMGPVLAWTRLLSHAITKTDMGGQGQEPLFLLVM